MGYTNRYRDHELSNANIKNIDGSSAAVKTKFVIEKKYNLKLFSKTDQNF